MCVCCDVCFVVCAVCCVCILFVVLYFVGAIEIFAPVLCARTRCTQPCVPADDESGFFYAYHI